MKDEDAKYFLLTFKRRLMKIPITKVRAGNCIFFGPNDRTAPTRDKYYFGGVRNLSCQPETGGEYLSGSFEMLGTTGLDIRDESVSFSSKEVAWLGVLSTEDTFVAKCLRSKEG